MKKYLNKIEKITAEKVEKTISEQEAQAKYKAVFDDAIRLSANNDADAGNAAAYMFIEGIGTEVNYNKALQIYQGLAKEKNIEAILGLARMYCLGFGVKKDGKKALELYNQTLILGYENAHFYLGMLYCDGIYVKRDYKKGLYHKKFIADKGDISYSYDVGLMYYYGQGTNIDVVEAIKYLLVASQNKNDYYPALSILGKEYLSGEFVEQDYKKAFNYYSTLIKINENDDEALYNLGYIHQNGFHGPIDVETAKSYYTKAAELKNKAATKALKLISAAFDKEELV